LGLFSVGKSNVTHWFDILRSVGKYLNKIKAGYWTLNQRVQGSSPCAHTRPKDEDPRHRRWRRYRELRFERGLLNRATSSIARRVIREYKTAPRERLIRLCRDAKLADPERLADEVFLLCEGARITAQSVGSEGLSSRLAGMLEALVADHARRAQQGELHGRVARSRR
jgi:hypothetical protein